MKTARLNSPALSTHRPATPQRNHASIIARREIEHLDQMTVQGMPSQEAAQFEISGGSLHFRSAAAHRHHTKVNPLGPRKIRIVLHATQGVQIRDRAFVSELPLELA